MSISYPIGNSGQLLVLSNSVLEHFNTWRQTKPGTPEAGGQLFGVSDGANVIVQTATGPRCSDRRGRFFFIADRLAERREIRALHRRGLHYFGDWHTHPEAVPTPSPTDLSTMVDLYTRSKHELNAFVMIIVGRAEFPEGVHVSLHEASAWSHLHPG